MKAVKKINKFVRVNRRRVLIVSLVVMMVVSPLVYLKLRSPAEAAAWWNDDWHYRKAINITNSGSADANKKVLIEADTAGLVDPDGLNYHTQDVSFTEAMAKRDTSANVFAASPIVQGGWNATGTSDSLTHSRGSAINGYFYPQIDHHQGSLVLWITPEWNGNDGKAHQIYNASGSSSFLLYKDTNNNLYAMIGNRSMGTSISTWTAGTTYNLVLRWDTDNTLDGTNYISISIDNTHVYGATSAITPNTIALNPIIGSNANAIIEGLTIYRRPLFDGTNGIDAGNGDEIRLIYDSDSTNDGDADGDSPQDPTLVTGSWDVVFALPTNSSTGALASPTATGEAWTHPHSSNLLTNGFLLDTPTWTGWTMDGTPTATGSATTSEKIFAGGGYFTSDAAGEGMYQDITVSEGDDWVIRGVVHGDANCDPRLELYDQTGSASIGYVDGSTSSDRDTPDVLLFTGEAPTSSTTLRVRLLNTDATGGTCYWHQVEVLSNLVNNPSLERVTGTPDPWIPDDWAGQNLDAGDTVQETSEVHTGSSALEYTSAIEIYDGIITAPSTSLNNFYNFGVWGYESSGDLATYALNSNHMSNSGVVSPTVPYSGASWTHYPLVFRMWQTGADSRFFLQTSSAGATGYVDDAYVFQLTDVSLTVTAATEANSTESTGLRVDGRDTATQTISNLTTTSGTIRFNWTPRHDAADALDFGFSIANVARFYGGGNQIAVYWSSANTLTLYFYDGQQQDQSWNATGAILAGTSYEMEIEYSSSQMTLKVDGATRITISDDIDFSGNLPTTAYWGSNNSSSGQTDATFDHLTQTSGTLLQPDCDDIRFTDANGDELDYYIDTANGACNTASTDFYVLVPTIHANDDTQIFMYYGNPSAAAKGRASQFSEATFTQSATSTGSQEVGPAPVGHWSFDEGYGTTANDQSSNNNDATISGAAWVEESLCLTGKCLSFDGSDDVLTVTNASAIDMDEELKDGLTYQAWVRVNSDGEADSGEVIDKGSDTYLRVTNEGSDGYVDLEASLSLSTAVASATITNGIKLDEWHHVAYSYTDDGDDEITVYIDGLNKGSSVNGDGSPGTDANSLLIGGSAGANFDGFIDEVKVYNYERSASQILTDFQQSPASHGAGVAFSDPKDWLSDGLVGYWKMDEDSWSGVADEVVDSSGNGNHGVGVGATVPTTTTGKFGKGGDFDGTDDYVNAGTSTSLNDIAVKTISAWVRKDVLDNDDTIASKWPVGGTGGWILQIKRSSDPTAPNRIFYYHNWSGQSGTWHGSTELDDTTQFYHVVVTYDSNLTANDPTIYVNGVADAITEGQTPTGGEGSDSTDSLAIGMWGTVWDEYDGLIDEVRVYNRALSPAEVRQLYEWAPGPVAHYKFDEGTGTGNGVIKDSSGNDNSCDMDSTMTEDHWRSGKYGSALFFDQTEVTDEFVDCGSPSEVNNLADGSFTAEAWINFSNTSGIGDTYSPIFGKKYQDTAGWRATIHRTNRFVSTRIFYDGQEGIGATNSNVIPTNEWAHFSMVFDNSTGLTTIYVNGIDQTNSGSSQQAQGNNVDDSSGELWIGDSDWDTGSWDGLIDDVRIYNYARTQGQIIEDMNAGHPAPGSPVGSSVLHLKFNEGYGDTANDSSPQNNDGDLGGSGNTCPGGSNCPAWSDNGKFGKALDFEYDNLARLNVPDSNSLQINGSFTLSTWATIEGVTSSNKTLVRKNDTAIALSNYDMAWAGATGNLECSFYNGSTETTHSTSYTPSVDTWYHFVCVVDDEADKVYMYIDGKQIYSSSETNSPTVTANPGTLEIGTNSDYSSRHWDGLIDEVKIYNFALTEDEVRAEYNRGASAVMGTSSTASDGSTADYSSDRSYCVPGDTTTCSAPIGEWKMDEKTGLSAYDTSENNNTGTLSGGPLWKSQGACKKGACLEFDGTDDLVNAQSGSSIDNLHYDTMTFEAWVRNDNWGEGSGGSIAILAAKNDLDGWRIELNSAGAGFHTIINTNETSASSKSGTDEYTNDGLWHHLVFTYDNDGDRTIYLYIDGSEVNSYTDQIAATGTADDDSGGNLYFGNNLSGTYTLDGAMDNVRMYNYIRTPAQIAWSYNRGAPVGHWKLNECQGATAYDSGSGGNNGTITIGGSGTQDGIGTCTDGDSTNARYNGRNGKRQASLDFDGADDYITITDTDDLSFGDTSNDSPFSISAWINLDDATNCCIFSKGSSTVAEYRFDTAFNDVLMIYLLDNAVGSGFAGTEVNSAFTSYQGSWTFVTATYDGSETASGLNIYINGNLAPSSDYSNAYTAMHNQAQSAVIGRIWNNGSNYCDGQIDDVRVYNYALTQDQIQMLYNEGAVGFR
jgi:hypothetical protein